MITSMTSLTHLLAPHRLHINGQSVAGHRLQIRKKCSISSQKEEAGNWIQRNLGNRLF